MSSVEEVEVLAEKLVQQFGAPYAIVNNAGCTRDALVVRMDHEQWRDIINTNLSSAYYSVRALTTPMMQNGGGCIINMSSVTAFKGNVGQVNYAATKAGLIGMTRSLAVELGRFNIRVNAVAPGLIETEIMEHLTEDQKRSFISNIPLRRMGAIDDVSAMIQFLLGAGGTYVTGQTFVVDGGLTA